MRNIHFKTRQLLQACLQQAGRVGEHRANALNRKDVSSFGCRRCVICVHKWDDLIFWIAKTSPKILYMILTQVLEISTLVNDIPIYLWLRLSKLRIWSAIFPFKYDLISVNTKTSQKYLCIWRTPSAGFAEQNGRNAKLNGRCKTHLRSPAGANAVLT